MYSGAKEPYLLKPPNLVLRLPLRLLRVRPSSAPLHGFLGSSRPCRHCHGARRDRSFGDSSRSRESSLRRDLSLSLLLLLLDSLTQSSARNGNGGGRAEGGSLLRGTAEARDGASCWGGHL